MRLPGNAGDNLESDPTRSGLFSATGTRLLRNLPVPPAAEPTARENDTGVPPVHERPCV